MTKAAFYVLCACFCLLLTAACMGPSDYEAEIKSLCSPYPPGGRVRHKLGGNGRALVISCHRRGLLVRWHPALETRLWRFEELAE